MMQEIGTQAVALAHAKQHGRVRAMEVAEKSVIGIRFARAVLKDLETRNLIGPPDDLGWQKWLPHVSEDQEKHTKREHTGPTDRVRDLDNLLRQVVELEARVAKLLESGRIIISQRDGWKARALAAEACGIQSHSENTRGEEGQFLKLKRVLARELHPGQSQGQGIDRLLRETIFKRIWPLVEDIERGS